MNGRRQNLLNGRTALLLAGTGLICVVAVAGTLEKSIQGWIHTVAVVLLAALFFANYIWLSGGRAEKAPYRYIQSGSCIPVILYGCYVFGSLDFAVYSLFVQCMVMYLFLDLKLFRVNEALTVITFLALILVEKAGVAGISYDKSTLVGAGCLAFSLWITDMRIQMNRRVKLYMEEQEMCQEDLNRILESKCREAKEETQGKQEFLTILSEEIRQPLYDLLEQAGSSSEGGYREQTNSSEKMSGTGRRLLSILNSITDYSRAQSGTLPLHTKDYQPKTVMELLQMVFGEETVEYKIDQHIPEWLHGDDVRLTQVLIYLLNRIIQLPQYQGIKVSMTGMSESRQNYKLYCEVEAVAKDLPEDAKQWGISVMITAKILECMGCELILERKKKDRVVFSFALPQEVALLSSREDAWWFLDEFDSKVEI